MSSRPSGSWDMKGRAGRRRPAALPILVVFVLIAAVTFLYSPAFDVREVTVLGNAYFSAQEVQELAEIPRDKNMLLINSSGVAARILRAPRMESASVRKRYLSKMEIVVVERKTVAYLPFGGFFMDLSKDGLVIGVSEAVTDRNVPIVTGTVPSFVLLGETAMPADSIGAACKVGEMLAVRNVPNISEVNVKDTSDIVIITNEGSRLMLGAADGIEERLDMAVDILAGARSRKQAFKYIDVRVTERPVLGTK